MLVGSDVTLSDREHAVNFYEDDVQLASLTVGYLAAALADGDQVVVIATPEHCQIFQTGLDERGIDVAEAQAGGRLVMVDAAETMARFLVGGLPDVRAFDATVGSLLRRTIASGASARCYGEMVALLWDAGEFASVLKLEHLWEALIDQLPISLLCAYPMSSTSRRGPVSVFSDVCAAHSGVLGGPPAVDGARLTRHFPRAPEAPAHARRFVADSLQRWGCSDLVPAGSLVVTELATNAVRHANSSFTVSLVPDGGAVRLFVGDSAQTLPEPQATDLSTFGGRGLQIVEGVSGRWGHELRPDGKVVWAELTAETLRGRAG